MLRVALMLALVGTFQDAKELVRNALEKVQKRDYAGAIEDLTRAVEIDPKEWRIYGLRADAKKEAGDLDGAILDYTKAIDLDPSHALAYAGRASARHLKKDLDGAIQDYSAALRLAPKDADLYDKRAAVKIEHYDYNGAVTDCKKALELDPKDTVALLNLASVQLIEKDFDAALSSSSKAIEIDPRWPLGYDMRGTVEYTKGDYALALKDADQAIQLDAEDPNFHYLRACCLMARSNGNGAKAAFDLALKKADDNWFYHRRAESLLSVLPDLTGVSSTVPFRRRILEEGRALLSRGETDKAIEVLEEAVRVESRSLEAHEALAGARLKRSDERRGDWQRAKVLVLEVVDLGKGLSPQMQRYLNAASPQVLSSVRWLSHHQMADGRWSGESVVEACRKDGTPKCEGKGQRGSDLRATSLAILAFLGAGYCQLSKDNYDTKPIGETVKKALLWMLAQQKADGSFGDPASERFLEDHAIATLVMSEVYGLTASLPLKDPAQKAVDFLVMSRVSGKGWGINARNDGPEAMATGWALMALKSAKLSELKVPPDAMNQGLEWLIGAALNAQPAHRDVAGTFAIAVASFLEKKLDGELLKAYRKAISEVPPEKAPEERDALFTFLSAMALRLGDNGPLWQAWGDRAKRTLQGVARSDDQGNGCPAGSWDPIGPADGPRGRVITTALNTLTLETCWRYRDVFCIQAEITRSLEIDPKYADAYYKQGNVKKDQGDFDGAIADYTRAIEIEPNHADAHSNRGIAKQAKGDLDGAIADYTRAIEINPKHAYAYYNRGNAKRVKGDLDGSLVEYTRAIEIDPKYASAYANRGGVELEKADLQGCIADSSRAIEIDPKQVHAYFNRGIAKQNKGDLEGAILDYSRTIEIDPKYPAAHYNRGLAKQDKGDLDGALADYTRAIELDPKRTAAWNNRGNVKRAKGDWDGAIADYNRAVEIDPKHASAYTNRGRAKQAKGDLEGSIADYSRAIEMDPEYGYAHFNRGHLLYDMCSWKDALAEFQKVCELDPSIQEYPRFYVWLIRSRLNERDAATKELARYFAERKTKGPEDWPSKIARLFTGDLSEDSFLKAAGSNDPKIDREQKCEAYFYAGSRRLIEGDKTGAKELFQKCLDTGVMNFTEYTSAAAELKRLGK